MRPVRTLTGTTQTSTIKFTWARCESMKCLHETSMRLQIGKFLFFFCGLLHCAALLIRMQLEARKKERITPSLLRTNIPRLRERTVKNKRRWWIAPGWTNCWWMKMWNEEALSLIFFRLFPVIRHLEMVQQRSCACSKQWSLTGLKSVCVYMVPLSDFRLVRVIHVGSATGMSETGIRWLFRLASCKQKQAFVWRPIWSRTSLSSYQSHVIRA